MLSPKPPEEWLALGSDPVIVSETRVQDFFDKWSRASSVDAFDVAGVPQWLWEVLPSDVDAVRRQVRHTTGQEYAFVTDIEWGPENAERHVLELKSAHKYEPIGLAEVLHHAQSIPSRPRPILVTRPNAWNRQAIQWLRDHGLAETALRYVELELIALPDQRILAWFDDPFAPWEPCERPCRAIPDTSENLSWFRVDQTVDASSVWCGVPASVGPSRPLLSAEQDAVTVARTQKGSWVAWRAKGRGTYLLGK